MMTRYATYPEQRIIPFEGARNFRDMGGYRTIDGRTVKYGLFFRSGELTGLTEQDRAFFASLNIKYVFDYRDHGEADLKPDPVWEHVRYERVPANNHHLINTHHYKMEDMVQSDFFKNMSIDTMSDFYAKMSVGNPSYSRLMQVIQDPDNLGLLHHCAAGKDRTGVGGALILLALGVPKATVMEDYLLTNEEMGSMSAQYLEVLAGRLSERELRIFETMMGAKEEFLEAVFASMTERCGDTDAYLEKEYGLTQEKRERLQSFCLE